MVTLATNTQPESEVQEALEANGVVIEGKENPTETEKVVESESTGAPGEKIPAETDGKTAAETEPVKDKTQGTQEPKDTPAEKPKSKGGFQAKNEKLTRQLEETREALELERGDKSKLRQKVEELEAQITGTKPPIEEKKSDELVRPKRPTMKDVDFDQDQYESAMDKYDADLDVYHAAVSQKKAKDELTTYQQTQERKAAEAVAQKEYDSFVDRRDKSASAYDDYQDTWEALPDDAQTVLLSSDVVRGYVAGESPAPAHLIRFFAKDFLENDGAESERIAALNPIRQLLEIKKIEDRLIDEISGKGGTAAATTEKPESTKPPAKPEAKRVEPPESPITPVNGRGAPSGRARDFNAEMKAASDAGDSKAFRKILSELEQSKRKAATG